MPEAIAESCVRVFPNHSESMSTKKPKSKAKAKPLKCHLISVGAGSLVWQIVHAVMGQYPTVKSQLVTHAFVDTAKKVESTLKKVRGKNVCVFHALLDSEAKAKVTEYCQDRGIPEHDMTEQLLGFVTGITGVEASNDPSEELDDGYFRRLDALEFTLQHDDSRRLESISDADIVVVGLSRVSKTPTSCYLGSMGFKVANVSLVPEIGLPKELKRGMKKKVVAFTIQPKRLQQIRSRRMQVNKFDATLPAPEDDGEFNYTSLKSIIREVMDAEAIYRDREFPIIDITDHTVEATATTVLQQLNLQRPE